MLLGPSIPEPWPFPAVVALMRRGNLMLKLATNGFLFGFVFVYTLALQV
jgi:uncharacterized membrane protein YjfL (UPF0719 family)